MSLEVEIKARVSTATKQRLAAIAKQRGEGWKISAVVREAVQEYLARRATLESSGKVTYLTAAETPAPRTEDSSDG